jgi:tryptophanyl-tRNA synthetase
LSKSYGNAIALSMTEDETAAVIRRTVTDSDRRITFDPGTRPGVSALLSTAALCLGTGPQQVAERIGDAGSGRLKQLTTEVVNDFLAGYRQRRRALAQDPGTTRDVLRRGNARANAIAEATLAEVRNAMGTSY